VMLLAQHFLFSYSEKYGKSVRSISQEAIDVLVRYDWPGNIRELKSLIEYSVLLCQDETITTRCFPDGAILSGPEKHSSGHQNAL
ncbi:MAG: hypothetical protein ACREDR_04600, partial [Blastocatellia bacterium]